MATERESANATADLLQSNSTANQRDLPTPGQILRATRIQGGYDRDEAARAANLGVSIVMALEADDFATLGLPVYARGYYRRYAKVIRCDADTVLSAYERMTDNPSPVPQIAQRPSIPYGGSSFLQKYLPVLAMIVVGLVVAYLFLGTADEDAAEPAVESESGRPALAGNAQESSPGASEPTLAPLPDPRRMVEVDMQAALRDGERTSGDFASRQGTAAQKAGDPASSQSNVPQVPPNRLEIMTGPQAAWIEVIDALGEKLAYRVVNPGETLVLDGDPPYSINLGMAHTLTVRYGGQPVNLQPVTDSASRARGTIAANGELLPR